MNFLRLNSVERGYDRDCIYYRGASMRISFVDMGWVYLLKVFLVLAFGIGFIFGLNIYNYFKSLVLYIFGREISNWGCVMGKGGYDGYIAYFTYGIEKHIFAESPSKRQIL